MQTNPDLPPITDTEFKVMEQLWKRAPESMTAREITNALMFVPHYVVKTMLSRLMKKGLIVVDHSTVTIGKYRKKRQNAYHYALLPSTDRESRLAEEIDDLARRFLNGDAQKLVAFLIERDYVSVEAVKKMVLDRRS